MVISCRQKSPSYKIPNRAVESENVHVLPGLGLLLFGMRLLNLSWDSYF